MAITPTCLRFVTFLKVWSFAQSALQVSRSEVILSGVLTLASAVGHAKAFGVNENTMKAAALKTKDSSSKTLRIVFNGGDNMLGRAVQLTFPAQAPGEESITDSCTASHYLSMCLHPSGHPDGDPSLDDIRELNKRGDYLWKDYRRLVIDPPPDLRVLNLESHITRSIDNPDVPSWKGIRYHTHVDNLNTMVRPFAETTHGDCARASPVVLSMANNHVMDYGRMAFDLETLPALESLEAAIPSVRSVGSGKNWLEASRPAAFRVPAGEDGRNVDVEVLAVSSGCSGTPSSWWADEERSGVVGIPALTSGEAVDRAVEITRRAIDMHRHRSSPLGGEAAEENCIRILSVHMGPNWALRGEDEDDIACRREYAHRVIDSCGVDVIYGHSSHHARGIEVYKSKLVLYGAGDIINDYEGFENRGDENYNRMGGVYVVDVDAGSGDFSKLQIVPMYMNRLRLERYRTGSKMWSPIEQKLGIDEKRGRDLAVFMNKLSEIDSGDKESALMVEYIDEKNSSIPGGPVLASKHYATS